MIPPTPASVFIAALRTHWKLIAGGLVLAALALLVVLLKAEKRHSAKLQTQLTASVEARKADRASYQNAQVAAAAMNKAQVETIEAKQEKISAEVQDDYAGDLARLRAELGRVRSKGNAAPVSAPRSAQASSVPKPAASADGPSGVCLSPSLVLRGAETELQLNALITWVEEQGKVGR